MDGPNGQLFFTCGGTLRVIYSGQLVLIDTDATKNSQFIVKLKEFKEIAVWELAPRITAYVA